MTCAVVRRFVGADDGPLGDAVLHATEGMAGSESRRGSKLALQHLQKWGLPTSGALWSRSLLPCCCFPRKLAAMLLLPGSTRHDEKQHRPEDPAAEE